jgi:hypothetical protein
LDELVEFNEESFNDFDLNLEAWGLDLEFSELCQDCFEMNSNGSVKFLISDLLDIDVNTDGNTK